MATKRKRTARGGRAKLKRALASVNRGLVAYDKFNESGAGDDCGLAGCEDRIQNRVLRASRAAIRAAKGVKLTAAERADVASAKWRTGYKPARKKRRPAKRRKR